jgi:hypothetical protein
MAGKGSGTVVRSTLRAVPATVPEPLFRRELREDRRGLTTADSDSWTRRGPTRKRLDCEPGLAVQTGDGVRRLVQAVPVIVQPRRLRGSPDASRLLGPDQAESLFIFQAPDWIIRLRRRRHVFSDS